MGGQRGGGDLAEGPSTTVFHVGQICIFDIHIHMHIHRYAYKIFNLETGGGGMVQKAKA